MMKRPRTLCTAPVFVFAAALLFILVFFWRGPGAAFGDPLDNWHLRTSITPSTSDTLFGTAHDGVDTFVAVGDSATILTSTGGVDWTALFSDYCPLNGVAYGGDKFVAVGGAVQCCGNVFVSGGGSNWDVFEAPACVLRGVTYGEGNFVAVGSGGNIATSPDGASWSNQTTFESVSLNGVTYGNGVFVAVGSQFSGEFITGAILTQLTGSVWSRQAVGTASLNGVTYGNGLFVAVGNGGTILTSPNGVNWTPQTSGTSTDLRGVTYGSGTFVAVGGNVSVGNTILTSGNGADWTPRSSGTFQPLNGVAFGNDTFVAVGVAAPGAAATDALSTVLQSDSLTLTAPPAYISLSSDNAVALLQPGTDLQPLIPVGLKPIGVAVNPARTLVYVTNYDSNTVSVIDTETDAVRATIRVGRNPVGVAVSPDGALVYAANYNGRSASVINTATNRVIATVTVGSGPSGVAVSPNGSTIYVTNYLSGSVSVIRKSTVFGRLVHRVVATIGRGSGAYGVAFHPSGARAYVTNFAAGSSVGNTVSVINTATNRVIKSITVGTGPTGVAINPEGTKAYVTNFGAADTIGTLSVIDTLTETSSATIEVGSNPYGVSVNTSGSLVYVANRGSGDVSIIDTSTNEVIATEFLCETGCHPVAFGNFLLPDAAAGRLAMASVASPVVQRETRFSSASVKEAAPVGPTGPGTFSGRPVRIRAPHEE